jgi:small conductance mechanosensitive channel
MNLEQAFHLIFDKLQLWLSELIKMLPNLALATVILVVGFFLAIRSLAKKIFKKFSLTSTLVGLAVYFVYILFIGIVIFTALKVLHLDTTITTMLASAGVIGLALAFAFQDIAANFISGIFISFRKPFGVGDMIKVKDYTGKVEEIRLRDTTIITFQGQVVTIPNKDVFQNPIENYTKYGKRRVDIKSGVSQGDDLNMAKKIALEAVADLEGILKEETSFYFDGLGESTINFTLRLWVNKGMQVNYLQVQSDAIIKIKEAFEQNDISLPFPIRTLDFGMKGGKTLADMAIQVANNSQKKDENIGS